MSSNRPRVLLLAEACNPRFSSVPLQAYYRYSAMRRYVDVTLATQVRNRPGFVQAEEDLTNVVFIDSERVAAPLHKLGRVLTFGHPTALGTRAAISWPAYLYFEYLVWKRFKSELCMGAYDCVHRITPLSPVFPSPIAKRLSVPFILGPLNGALPWPRGSRLTRWREGELLAPLRRGYRLLPFVRQTYERAALILTASKYVEDELPGRLRCRCVRYPENGVDIERFTARDRTSPGRVEPFTILFVGRLIPLKKPGLIIDAIRRWGVDPRRVRLVFVGAGPEEPRLREMVRGSPLEAGTLFNGWVSHDALPDIYRQASVLALPSIHESGGAVLLEAMASGLPCVVVDHGGPAEYITTDVGALVPLGSDQEIIDGLASAFRRLYDDREYLDRLSAACIRVAQERWCWDAHAQRTVSLYDSVLK